MGNIWVITPYGNKTKNLSYKQEDDPFQKVWQYDLMHNTVAIGSSYMGDSTGKTKQEIQNQILEKFPLRSASMKAQQLWSFFNEVKKDDYIVAKTGLSKVLGLGRIFIKDGKISYYSIKEGLARCGNKDNPHPNFLNVQWKEESLNFGKHVFIQGRFGRLDKMLVNKIREEVKKLILERIDSLFCESSRQISLTSSRKGGKVAKKNIFKNIVSAINLLKKDPVHKERAHESLVEMFYEKLGYEKFTEIKHRQGRIDISVEEAGKIKIVNEVKRDWALSKENLAAVFQGYGYSLETGAIFVVVSNGDYYAVFDRRKGYTYKENFRGEFQLTSLCNRDFDVIKILRKKS